MIVAYSETVKVMWDDLKKRYGMANTPKTHQLKANLANCKQGNLSTGDFYSKLINLWTEFTNLVKVPVCTCKKCDCGVVRKIMAMYEEDKAHQFLKGLNGEIYSSIRIQILSLDPLPPLHQIFNMIQQEEHHRHVMATRDNRKETAMAFAIKGHTGMVEKTSCQICGHYGHEEMACYKVIGYPPSWGTHGRGCGACSGRNNRGGRGASRGRGRETVAAVNYQEEEAGPDFSPGSQTVAACTGSGPVLLIGSGGSNNKTSAPNKCSDP